MGCHKAFLIDNWASKGHVIRRKELIWRNKAFFMENLASKLAEKRSYEITKPFWQKMGLMKSI